MYLVLTINLNGAPPSSAALEQSAAGKPVRWCAVGDAETSKCDTWSINSMVGDTSAIQCQFAPTVDECLKMIMVMQWRKETGRLGGGGEVVKKLLMIKRSRLCA